MVKGGPGSVRRLISAMIDFSRNALYMFLQVGAMIDGAQPSFLTCIINSWKYGLVEIRTRTRSPCSPAVYSELEWDLSF